MKNVRSSLWLFAIGISALMVAHYFQREGAIQGIGAHSIMYLGIAGRFAAWLSVGMLVAFLWIYPVSPVRRTMTLGVLFLIGTFVMIVGPPVSYFLQMLRTNPLALISSYHPGVFSVGALIYFSALLASARHQRLLRYRLSQLLGTATLLCILLAILRTRGSFAFAYFLTLTLLGIIGYCLAELAVCDQRGRRLLLVIVGLTIATIGLFAAQHAGWFYWLGPSPMLAMFTVSGILPIATSVFFAVAITLALANTNATSTTTEP